MDINRLYNSAKDGDKRAKDRLFQNLHERFRLFVSQKVREPEDARDIVQDTLTTIADAYETIEIEKSFVAWAYKILQNKVYEYYRSTARKRSIEDKIQPDEPKSDKPEVGLMRLKERLLNCLHKVHAANRRYARILVLQYQGFQPREICGRLELSANNYYIILHRARKLLEQCLAKDMPADDDLLG